MEDKKVFSFALKAGVTIAVIMIVVTFITFFADVNTATFWNKAWIKLLHLVLIVGALFYFSRWALLDRATMIQTIVASLTMGVVYFVIFYVFEAVYVHWIDSGFLQRVLAYKQELDPQLSYEQISALRLEIESKYAFSVANFIKQFFFTFLEYTAIGAILGYFWNKNKNINTSY